MLDVRRRTPFELSKIGDPFVNLVYSLALSQVFNRPLGKKVSNKILSEALSRTKLREHAGSRMTKEDLGDFAEGIIFRAWANGDITIKQAVEIISQNLSPNSRGKDLKAESVTAFEALLKKVATS
jgi:hypothetical protein